MQLTTQTQSNEINQGKADVSLVLMPPNMTMNNAATLRGALLKLINNGASKIIVDLHKVQFIDSSGLSVLVTAFQRLEQSSGEIVLLSPSNDVLSLIELTQLHQIFTIHKDKQAALFYIARATQIGRAN